MEGHRPGNIVAIILAFISYLVVIVFNVLASAPGIGGGLFYNQTGAVAGVYPLDITPAGWAFSIWGIIYIWLGLFLLYALSTLCRTTAYGSLYVYPPVLTAAFYVMYIFSMAGNVIWLFLWDRHLIGLGLVTLVIVWLALIGCVLMSLRGLYNHGPVYIREENLKEIWFVRILVHNGLGIYLGWSTVAMLLNMAIVLAYGDGPAGNIEQETASTASLCVLLVGYICWFFLDIYQFDKYSRYLVTPYCVITFAMIGSVAKNFHEGGSNLVLTMTVLLVSAILGIIKMAVLIYRHFKCPIWARVLVPQSFFERKPSYGSSDYVRL